VCDTLCILGDGVTLFAKNSDRPRSEPQVVSLFAPRGAGGTVGTQYREIPDTGAFSTLLSRPTWLWGAEHGVNDHGVAIGNEAVFTRDDASKVPAALIGMDLVRLGLERGADAAGALDVMISLLESEGQGGVCDTEGLAYWSSFLIADPTAAWILETTGQTWAARPVEAGAAISNRLTLGRQWTRASDDVPPGTDVDSWSLPGLPTGFADTRLAAGRAFVETACTTGAGPGSPVCDPRAVVEALRDHGPGAPSAPAPDHISPDGAGWTLCLHAGKTVTTASMVAVLPAGPDGGARAWVALGSPCTSVYVPVPVPSVSGPSSPPPVPPVVGDASVWQRFASLRDAVGSDAGALATVRHQLSALEESLWAEADGLDADPDDWVSFGATAGRRIGAALDRLAVVGLGPAGEGHEG
jgi:secernin